MNHKVAAAAMRRQIVWGGSMRCLPLHVVGLIYQEHHHVTCLSCPLLHRVVATALPMAMSHTVPLLGHNKWFPPWFTVLERCFCYFSRSEVGVALPCLWISQRPMDEVVVVRTPCSKDTTRG